jgi:hypothetical protein
VPDASTRAREADRQIRDLQGLSSDLNLAQVTNLDGTLPDTDLSDAFGTLLERCYQENRVAVYSRRIRVSGGFDVKGPGLAADVIPFGNVGEACIEPIGTGYTVLRVTSQFHRFAVSIAGGNAGASVNGVLFDNATFCDIDKIRVTNLDGFGVKLNKFWDSTAKHISIERCGNASEYAFSVNGDGDTSNESWIARLQVEQSLKQAMLFDDNTLNCLIGVIHSERGRADAAKIMWYLSGARTRFLAGRFHALEGVDGGVTYHTADAVMQLRGENVDFGTCAVEAGLVDAKGAPNAFLTVQGGNWNGVDKFQMNNSGGGGRVVIKTTSIKKVSTTIDPALTRPLAFEKCQINTLEVLDCGNPALPERLVCEDCNIGVISSGSTNAAARIEGGQVDDLGSGLGYLLELAGDCRAIAHSGGSTVPSIKMSDTARVVGNLTITESGVLAGKARVEGNLTGTNSTVVGPEFEVTGTATGMSAAPAGGPNVHLQYPSNNWPKGMTHWDPAPASGSPFGWRCTAAGAPGTWKSMGNLA